MPTQVIPGQRGGGFFDAATQGFNEFSKRAQDAMLHERELQISKDAQKLAEKRFELEKSQHAFEQQRALDESKRRFAELALATVEQREASADRNRRTGIQQQEVTQQGAYQQGQLGLTERGQDFDMRIAEMNNRRLTAADATEKGKLDLGIAQLNLENDQFNRQIYVDQIRTMGELAGQFQLPPTEIPRLLQQFYGSPTGDPQAIHAQDQEAFKTEAEDGETFNAFRQRKTVDRALGFFGISAEDRPLIESFINTGNPLTGLQRAEQAISTGQLPEEARTTIHALLRIIYPTQQQTFESPGNRQNFGQVRPLQPNAPGGFGAQPATPSPGFGAGLPRY